MSKQIWIPCIIILAVCLALLLLKIAPAGNTTCLEPIEVHTNYPQDQPERPKIFLNPKNADGSNYIQWIPHVSEVEASNLEQQALADWQAPIDFYGKVVDDSNNPVAGVDVEFKWTETPREVFEGKPGESTTIKSDTEGLFELHGKRGPDLSVNVSKQGYYAPRSNPWAFSYAINGHFSPNPLNPVVFHLRKKGQGVDLITSENGTHSDVWARVPKDGNLVRVDFFQKQAGQSGQLEIKQIKPSWNTAANWSFSLTIPTGGLVENQDEFQFEAPEAGYQATMKYSFAKSETNWVTHVTKQFYFVFGNPRQFGWLRFESDLAQETVFVTYAINPTGLRDLEPIQ